MKLFAETKHLKLFLKVGSLIFIGIMLFFLFDTLTRVYLEDTSRENETKIIASSKEINKNKDSYQKTLDLLIQQKELAERQLITLNYLESRIYYKYLPEYGSSLSLEKSQVKYFIVRDEISIEWYEEALKSNPDNVKLQNLQEKLDNEDNKFAPTFNKIKLADKNFSVNVAFKHLWSFALIILLVAFGAILTIGNFVLFTKRLKSKLVLPSLGWFFLGACDLSLLIFLIWMFSLPLS